MSARTNLAKRASALALLAVGLACGRDTTAPRGVVPQSIFDWIRLSAHPITSLTPTTDDSDLAPLGTLVGSARLVGLGEATHGSSEFGAMKDRALRYLVERKGFTGFAMEASMPEALALDHYVRTGEGDPTALLNDLHFWIWYTREVLDLVQWMRSYNATLSADRQIGFYGFDMQFPVVARDSVIAYAMRFSPNAGQQIAADYQCLSPYMNVGPLFPANYAAAGQTAWTACTHGLTDVRSQLTANQGTLTAASSPTAYALALQMARIVEQWEVLARTLNAATRDAAMAENITWLLQANGPSAKLVLWAHDEHIQRDASVPTMGDVLGRQFGATYLPIGFAFDSGSFNAVRQDPASGAFLSIQAMTAPRATAGSLEVVFDAVQSTPFLIDLRTAPAGDAQAWLTSRMGMREIGADYVPETPNYYWIAMYPAVEFDAFFFLPLTTPTHLLP